MHGHFATRIESGVIVRSEAAKLGDLNMSEGRMPVAHNFRLNDEYADDVELLDNLLQTSLGS
jgi:hypothetical protein